MDSRKRAKLSKNLLEMKFMKRTKEKVEKEEANEEAQTMFSKDITDAMRHFSHKYVMESSFVPVEDLVFGRFSFKGVNPEIERLMAQMAPQVTPNEEDEGVDVKAAEVSRHMNSGPVGIARKFATKRNWRAMNDPHASMDSNSSNRRGKNRPPNSNGHRGRGNRQFMKPRDE